MGHCCEYFEFWDFWLSNFSKYSNFHAKNVLICTFFFVRKSQKCQQNSLITTLSKSVHEKVFLISNYQQLTLHGSKVRRARSHDIIMRRGANYVISIYDNIFSFIVVYQSIRYILHKKSLICKLESPGEGHNIKHVIQGVQQSFGYWDTDRNWNSKARENKLYLTFRELWNFNLQNLLAHPVYIYFMNGT